MKFLLTVFSVCGLLFITGCTTPVAIDPVGDASDTGKFQAGWFYAPLDAPIEESFLVAIREMDEMGYFRTGELHRESNITIYARKVGDERVTVRFFYPTNNDEMVEGQSMVRIRVGTLGDLPESQAIYARLRESL